VLNLSDIIFLRTAPHKQLFEIIPTQAAFEQCSQGAT